MNRLNDSTNKSKLSYSSILPVPVHHARCLSIIVVHFLADGFGEELLLHLFMSRSMKVKQVSEGGRFMNRVYDLCSPADNIISVPLIHWAVFWEAFVKWQWAANTADTYVWRHLLTKRGTKRRTLPQLSSWGKSLFFLPNVDISESCPRHCLPKQTFVQP